MKKILLSLLISGLLMPAVSAAPTASPNSAAEVSVEAPPAITDPAAPPQISAAAYLVKDLQSGTVLAQSDADKPVNPASLVKMMTAYLVFQSLENGALKTDQKLTVSTQGHAAAGSRMFLSPQTPASVDDLLKGMIVQSANDAALTLAEAVGQGSVETFVAQMNQTAQRLGMVHTRFANPTGIGNDNQSSAADLSLLAAALIRDFPQHYPLFSIKSFKYNHIEQPNRNLLLFRDPNVDGLKTGYSESSGYHLAASSKRNGRRIVSVLIGAESTEERAAESGKLLNWALQAFDTAKLYPAGQSLSQIKVYKGSSNTVNIGFLNDAYITVPHDSTGGSIKPILETEQPVLAPIEKGSVLGKIKIVQNGKTVAEQNVVALESVPEAGWFGRIWDSIVLWFQSLFGNS
ncbi:D-alanyl-D-alanine carboxypeptidase [Neisseria sp. ZJ106]|uniref:serine-type D-Ala-D-Ala carboxypeptidase n=1 Tax=Neisseria lisongii TaxID=2912188 RepID=A0ABY7RMD9_9NEIS|nr:D-alanyl-D-alanine carboxypeptidase family protein [Neisseria lisongii]MCF7520699.1 D-alanyl-D-alanine carboxypeptidase [Neisseria lisongii]WCL72431.1 D-alanyl-D-alanine carboxypeptidase [Neisseria lisongii]